MIGECTSARDGTLLSALDTCGGNLIELQSELYDTYKNLGLDSGSKTQESPPTPPIQNRVAQRIDTVERMQIVLQECIAIAHSINNAISFI